MNSLDSLVNNRRFSIFDGTISKLAAISKLLLILSFIPLTITACNRQQISDNKKPIENTSANLPVTENKNNTVEILQFDADWKEFKDSKLGISFSYPSNLKIERLSNGIRLFHETKFEHSDPCDNSDDVKTLKSFADFDVFISIKQEKTEIPPVCQNSQISKETDSELDDECFVSNNLKGKIISARYQGCGDLKYIFALTDGKTLEITRNLVGIFGVGADPAEKKSAEQLSGAILREENNRIFYRFISSLKVDK